MLHPAAVQEQKANQQRIARRSSLFDDGWFSDQNGSETKCLNVPLETPAARGEVDTTEAVILGIGGSGKEVVARIIKEKSGDLPEAVHILTFDTDPDLAGLPPRMLVTLALPQADYIVSNRHRFPCIDHSLTPDFQSGKVFQGSMMKRMVTAGIVLPYHRRRIQRALRQRIVKPFLKRRRAGERTRVVVVVVGSMGGGFGSGAKDGITIMLRDLFRKAHRDIDVHVEWHALTPDVHYDVLQMDWQVRRANANALAAILENEAAFRDPSILPYRELGVDEPFARPIINGVRLYSAVDERGKMLETESVYNMAATCISTEVLAAIANPNNAHVVNMDLKSKHAAFGGSVAYRFVYPARSIERYTIYQALGKMLTHFCGERLNATETDRQAAQLLDLVHINGVAGRIESQLPDPPPLPMPTSANERATFIETLRRTCETTDARWRPELEQCSRDLAASTCSELLTNLQEEYKNQIAKVNRQTPADVRSIFEALLKQTDERLAAIEKAIAHNLPAHTASQFQLVLGEVEKRRRPSRRIIVKAVQAFRAYVHATKRHAALRTAASSLVESRPVLLRLIAGANATAEAIQEAVPKLDLLATETLNSIGAETDRFILEAVDRKWVQRTVHQVMTAVDWTEKATQVFGECLAEIDGRRALQSVLERSAAQAVAEIIAPHLSRYDALSSELPKTALAWLAEIADQAAPQFPFFEPNCFDEQTYYATMLAVSNEQAGRELVGRFFDNFKPEVVQTGDPNQVVLFGQRQFVPLEAAFPNLGDLVRDYQYWVQETKDQPQAQVASTRRYANSDLCQFLPAEFATTEADHVL